MDAQGSVYPQRHHPNYSQPTKIIIGSRARNTAQDADHGQSRSRSSSEQAANSKQHQIIPEICVTSSGSAVLTFNSL